jgi:hypothetical protein
LQIDDDQGSFLRIKLQHAHETPEVMKFTEGDKQKLRCRTT